MKAKHTCMHTRLVCVQYKLSADVALRRARAIEATYGNGIARDGRGPEQLDNEAAADPLTYNNNAGRNLT